MVRLAGESDPARGDAVLVVSAGSTDDVAGTTGTGAGKAMTSVEAICSILSRPSRIGVCARL